MTTIQSSSSSPSAVEVAGKTYRYVFVGYLAWLVLAGLVTAFFTWWVWRASNRQQDAIVAATDHENLVLRTDLNAEKGKVAGLQKAAAEAQRDLAEQKGKTASLEKAAADAQTELIEQQGRTANLEKAAADARAAQQRVEVDLAKQQERAAKAEKTLETERLERLRLEEAVAPRKIVSTFVMVDALKAFAGTNAIVEYLDAYEPRSVARDLCSILEMAGWHVSEERKAFVVWQENVTVWAPFIAYPSRASEAAMALVQQLQLNKIEVRTSATTLPPLHGVRISIGRQEATYLAERQRTELYRDFIFGEPTEAILEPLRKELQFTHFTVEQQHLFITTVEKPRGNTLVQLRCPANDDEACGLAMEIGILMRGAGWQIQNDGVTRDKGFPSMTRDFGGRFPEAGTRIVIVARWPAAGSLPSFRIAGAFKEVGFPVRRTIDVFDPNAPTLVVVYSKQ